MGTLYADASGTEQADMIQVSGFIAPAAEWVQFEDKWQEILRKAGIKYFRMGEFAQSTGQFKKGWKDNESQRRALLNSLIGIIAKHAKFGVGSCVKREDYARVDADYQLHEQMYPYTLCAWTCANDAALWHEANHIDEPIDYIFEKGDEHKGQLVACIEKKLDVVPIFRGKLDAGGTPLQAADFSAYESRLVAKKWQSDEIIAQFRMSFHKLAIAVPFKHGIYGEHELRVMCRALGIPRRGAS